MKKIFALLLLLGCIWAVGCGGSRGGDGGNNDGLTPQQRVFSSVIEAFANQIALKNPKVCDDYMVSDFLYNKELDYTAFKKKLDDFMSKAGKIDFQIVETGVNILTSTEDHAEIQAKCFIAYGENQNMNEVIRFEVKKYGSKYGIFRMEGQHGGKTAFPPTL